MPGGLLYQLVWAKHLNCLVLFNSTGTLTFKTSITLWQGRKKEDTLLINSIVDDHTLQLLLKTDSKLHQDNEADVFLHQIHITRRRRTGIAVTTVKNQLLSRRFSGHVAVKKLKLEINY